MKAGAPVAAGSARRPRPGSAAAGFHRGRLCYRQDGPEQRPTARLCPCQPLCGCPPGGGSAVVDAASPRHCPASETLPRLRRRNRAGRGPEPFPEVEVGATGHPRTGWERCHPLQPASRRKRGAVSSLPGAGGRLGTVIAAGCHQPPHQWGLGGLGRAAAPLAGQFSNLLEVTRQRGHSPTDAPVLILPQPRGNGASPTSGPRQRTRPRFCCFFPQSWVEAARGQGPRSLLVQNPLGDGEMTAGSCHRLPSPGRSLAEARASPGGRAPQGKRGRRCLPGAHHARGRKEGPFRTETTYHPRSPVTKAREEGRKSPAFGFLLLVSRDVPRGRGRSVTGAAARGSGEREGRAVSNRLLHQGNPFALWKCL